MEASKFIKKPMVLVGIIVIILVLVGGYFIYNSISVPVATTSEPTNNADLNNKIYDELSKPRDYGAPISTDEAGYGRPNPFAPYK